MVIIHIKIAIAIIRFSVLLPYYITSKSKELLDKDINRWCAELKMTIYKSNYLRLIYLLLFEKSFRNIFYFRCPHIPNFIKHIVCNPDDTLYIADYINNKFNKIEGGGIYIVHSFGTRIRAKSIGYGCTFRQLTTIGVKSSQHPLDVPTILNNVDFGANVCCFGNITIGNNCIIGAGSVVTKDIPDNAIVAGNPARIIRYKNSI